MLRLPTPVLALLTWRCSPKLRKTLNLVRVTMLQASPDAIPFKRIVILARAALMGHFILNRASRSREVLPAQPVDATPSSQLIRQYFPQRTDLSGCAQLEPKQGSVLVCIYALERIKLRRLLLVGFELVLRRHIETTPLLGNWLFEPREANSHIPRRPFLEMTCPPFWSNHKLALGAWF